MTGILGVADLLCNANPKLDEPNQSYAHLLFESAQQLLNVLNDLLNFSLLQKGNLALHTKPFAIRKTIEELKESARAQAEEKHLTLETKVADAVPESITADEERVRQVIAAMLANSLKFTSSGSIELSVELKDEQIKISVKDSGIGIADEDLDKIFLPFVQVNGGIRRTHGGSGLSLCIAKHLAELMHGQIGVESKSGQGSIFWFTFAGAEAGASHD